MDVLNVHFNLQISSKKLMTFRVMNQILENPVFDYYDRFAYDFGDCAFKEMKLMYNEPVSQKFIENKVKGQIRRY